MLDYPENNTDDEQEDLPYDGDLQNIYQYNCDSQDLTYYGLTSVENASQSVFTLTCPEINISSTKELDWKTQLSQQKKIHLARKNCIEYVMATKKELPAGDFSNWERNNLSSSKFSDTLLRHFPNDELLSSCQLIDAETIPDVSYTESFDETILNKIKISESNLHQKISSLKEKNPNNMEDYSSGSEEKCESVDKNWDYVEAEEFIIDEISNPSCDRNNCKEDNLQFVTQKEETGNEGSSYFPKPREKYHDQKYLLEMSGSSKKLKYGQCQVHYQLPDFSKVAPKVKIPKGNNNANPIIKRAKSSPNLFCKSALVKDVLEAMSSLDSVGVKNQEDEMRFPEFNHELELLTQQAEAQIHIDHLRFNTKMLPCSNSHSPNPGFKTRSAGQMSDIPGAPPATVPVTPMLNFSQSSFSESQTRQMISSLQAAGTASQSFRNSSLQKAAEGEESFQILKEQTEELKIKVEKMCSSMAQEVFPAQEHNESLILFKEQLDQLEQDYLALKEAHCALQNQKGKHTSRNTGEFDPDRKVEGKIFSLGMLLEDLLEKVDRPFSPDGSASIPSPSLSSCESVGSTFSVFSENPGIMSSNEPPAKTAAEVDIFKNEKNGGKRNHPTELIPQIKYQQSNEGSKDLSLQNRLELKNKNACEANMEPWRKAEQLANKQSIHAGGPQSHRQLITHRNDNHDHTNTERNVSKQATKLPTSASPFNMGNQESTTALKTHGSRAYPSHHSFLEGLQNSPKERNIVIHPNLKIQVSSNPCQRICSCCSSSNKIMEYQKKERGKSKYERFSISFEGTEMDLDSTGSDSEDASFSDLTDNSSSQVFLEQRIKNHGSCKAQNKGASQKKSISSQRINTDKEAEQLIYRLSDRQNLHIPQTCYSRIYDRIILSPRYLTSRNMSKSRSVKKSRKRNMEERDTEILNSTLDQAIQTANNLKKTTEHMMQVVSEDLAKAKTQKFSSLATCQYDI